MWHQFHVFKPLAPHCRLLKEVAEDMRYRKRYQLLFGALLSVVGAALRHEFSKQEDLTRMLAAIAEKVKAARDKDVSTRRFVLSFLAADSEDLQLNRKGDSQRRESGRNFVILCQKICALNV